MCLQYIYIIITIYYRLILLLLPQQPYLIMKQFPKLVFAFCIILFFYCSIPSTSFAQGPGDPNSPGDPGVDPDAPIDGGIGLLLGAGVLYGIHKIRREKKRGLSS